MNVPARCLWLVLALAPLRAETLWIEGERLVPADRPLGVDGAPPGWYKVPYLYGDESGAASLVSARRLQPGEVSVQEARVQAPAQSWYVWVRAGCRDRPEQSGFRLLLDDQSFEIDPRPEPGAKHTWVRAAAEPVSLGSPIRVRLEDDEPTTVAALDVLVLTDDPNLNPATMPLPRWPGASQARDLSARLWVPAMFDRPLHLVRGLTWPVLLAVTNRGAAPAAGVVELTLPPGIELLDPTGRGFPYATDEHFSLTAVTPTAIERDGAKIRLTLPEVPAGLDGMTSNAGVVALFLRTGMTASGGTIQLTTTATGQTPVTWQCGVVALDLPAAPGPKLAYWLLDTPYVSAFNEAERRALFASAAKLGHNRLNLMEQLTHDDTRYDRAFVRRYSDVAIEVREAGLEPVLGMVRWIPWTPYRTYSDRYLAENPSARAVQAPGSRALARNREVVSPTHLLDEDSTYLDTRLDALADLAHRAGIHEIYWDYEENRPLEFSFDGATLDHFERSRGSEPGEALGPVPRMDPETILSDPALREAWIGFRCEQNTAIAGMLRRRLGARVRDLRLHIYSGFQSERTKATYGVDWRLLAPFADGVIAGSGWANIHMIPDVHATWRAVTAASSRSLPMFVEHAICDWPGATRWSDPSTTAARVVLAAAAGAPGLNDCCSIYAMEGEHLVGIAAAAGFVGRYEALLLAGRRTIHDTNGDGYIDTVVVTSGDATLTVTANGTQHPQAFHPRLGQPGELPETLPLARGEWRAFESGVDG